MVLGEIFYMMKIIFVEKMQKCVYTTNSMDLKSIKQTLMEM